MTFASPLFLRASLAIALLLAASTAAPAADTMLARCGSDGATFHLSDASEEDASVVYGLPPAPTQDAVLVVNSDDGSAHWSTAPRRAIDRECGGDGDDEIVLFEPVQPRDGLWSSKLTDHRMSGCTAMLAEMVKSMLPAEMAKDDTKRLTFDKPFHPRGLMQDATQMRWMQVGPDRWRGVVIMENGGGQAGTSMNVAVTMHVVSPTHIDGATTVTVKMPPQFAAMMGGGSGTCRSVVRAKMSWSE